MEKDLEILRNILRRLKYTDLYIDDVVMKKLIESFENSGLDEITPGFVYSFFLPEEGRKKAADLSNYFEQMKSTGDFKTELEKHLGNLPYRP